MVVAVFCCAYDQVCSGGSKLREFLGCSASLYQTGVKLDKFLTVHIPMANKGKSRFIN